MHSFSHVSACVCELRQPLFFKDPIKESVFLIFFNSQHNNLNQYTEFKKTDYAHVQWQPKQN